MLFQFTLIECMLNEHARTNTCVFFLVGLNAYAPIITLAFPLPATPFQHNLKCVVGRRFLDVVTGGYCFRLRIGGDRELSLLGQDKVMRFDPCACRLLKCFSSCPRVLHAHMTPTV